MTVTETTARLPVTPDSEFEPAEPPPARQFHDALRRSGVIAGIALLVLAVAWGVFQLFEGPVARAWYTARQRQLASQFQAPRRHAGRGAAIAVMQIPRLGVNVVVAEGDAAQQLRSGPGHRMGTPLPGDLGNSVIVGHRAGWGGPFSDLATLRRGDHVVVQTKPNGLERDAVFTVISIRPLGSTDLSPFRGSNDHRLTIVAGTGDQFSTSRIVVIAVSGRVGKVIALPDAVRATTPAGSSLWNPEALLALVGISGGLVLVFALRGRYRSSTVAIASLPLFAVGLVGVLLAIDVLLPPLR